MFSGSTDPEYLTPDDYGALTRAMHAQSAANDHYNYLVQRLFAKYRMGPSDAFEPDGRITREAKL
jgi:hypothetical protein